DALLGGQPGRVAGGHLVGLASLAALDPLIAILHLLAVGAGFFPVRHEPSLCLIGVAGRRGGCPLEPPPYPSPRPRHTIGRPNSPTPPAGVSSCPGTGSSPSRAGWPGGAGSASGCTR